jgi:CheY-like chemotaxis protein
VTAPSGWVLVVDDDAADRMALFRLLERAGHHVTVADGGQAALELLRAETFDLVLLDLLMPGPDGFAVLEAMKGDRWLPAVPVIAITALDDPGSVERSIGLGAEDYLAKPVDPVLLRSRVDASLEKKRLREREGEYLDVVGSVAQAADAVAKDEFEPESLEPAARRADPLGQLARAVRDLASRVSELRRQLEQAGSGPAA